MKKFKIPQNTEQRWKVKAKCEKCKLVNWYARRSGVRISDRECLVCNGRVKATSHSLQGFEHIYADDLTVIEN